MVMRKTKKGQKEMLEKFWIPFTLPDKKEGDILIPQGFAEISIELIPKSAAKEKENGMGRDAPN
jgi:hypothetical protein